MLTTRHVAVGIAIAICACGVGLQGQEPQGQEPQAPELPVSSMAGWTFVPGVIVGAMYDSNVAVTTSVDQTGHPPSDTLFTIDPTGSLRYLGRRSSFDASYRGNVRRYTSFGELDGYDQQAGVSFDRRATKRLTVDGHNRFATAPTTDQVDLAGVPFRHLGSKDDTLGAGLTFLLAEHTDLTARYDFTWVSFDREAPDITGGTINSIRSAVTQQLSNRLRAGGEGSYRFADMDVGDGRHLQFIDVGGTIAYRLGEFTTVSAAGGASHVDDELGLSRSGPYTRASISHTAERAVFGASYEHSLVPSFGFGGSTRNQRVMGWINLPPIGRRLYLRGSTTYSRSNPFDIGEALRLDTITLHATAGYTVSRQIRLQGVYIFTHQDSKIRGSVVNRNRIGIQLVLFNPVRIP